MGGVLDEGGDTEGEKEERNFRDWVGSFGLV